MPFMKGAEPFSFSSSSKTGILVIHGYTGTTSSVLPLAQHLADKGFNIEAPCLAGHGTQWPDLNMTGRKEWITNIETSLAKLRIRCKDIFVSGLSVGGLLALYLAENHPELKGTILINPALFYKDPRLFLLPVLRFLMPAAEAVKSDIKDPNQKEIGYDKTPLQGLYQTTLLQKSVRKKLSSIHQPIIIFTSRNDHVIPPQNADMIMQGISSKEKEHVWLENSYHVATLDFDSQTILDKAYDFILKNITP